MAGLLTMAATLAKWNWWPVDKVILAYLGAMLATELAFWSRLPEPGVLLLVHLAGIALIFLAVAFPANVVAQIFHYWYPLPYVFYCYREMSILIRALRAGDADATLARLDFALWGANPSIWLERLRSPLLAETLEIVYSLFVPAVLMVAFILWKQKRFYEFRYYAFLIAVGYLVSYIGYFLVPARGPRFLFRSLQSYELHGLFLFDWLYTTLDRLETAAYDCFPSGHTEMSILAWWGARMINSKLFLGMSAYTLGVIFATVYLRYHYTVDILAGALVAGVLILIAPRVYRALGGKTGGDT
jgi:membrane-associated phospholipid phosphatase